MSEFTSGIRLYVLDRTDGYCWFETTIVEANFPSDLFFFVFFFVFFSVFFRFKRETERTKNKKHANSVDPRTHDISREHKYIDTGEVNRNVRKSVYTRASITNKSD